MLSLRRQNLTGHLLTEAELSCAFCVPLDLATLAAAIEARRQDFTQAGNDDGRQRNYVMRRTPFPARGRFDVTPSVAADEPATR
jgi:hypothetical protein